MYGNVFIWYVCCYCCDCSNGTSLRKDGLLGMLNIIGIVAAKSATILFCEGVTTIVTIYGIYHGSNKKRQSRSNSRSKQGKSTINS